MCSIDDVTFPALRAAARRLGLDAGKLGEAVLHAVDCGFYEMEATQMALVEYLTRRGLYKGELRRLVDSGRVFSLEGKPEGEGRRDVWQDDRNAIRGRETRNLSPIDGIEE